ncbi:MAG: NADPH:quinone reductase [Pseudonocardiales bacterium]|nr:NADPH:quinone reductase [Pseudonocardiales bacterium]
MATDTSNATISALVVPTHGGPEVLEVQQRPAPEPGPGQLLVEVAASGVNYKDVYEREGSYPRQTPFVLGDELAGRVLALGDRVEGFAVGDAVASAKALGAHASRAVVDAAQAVPVPDHLDLEIAAAAMVQGITAHYLLNSSYRLGSGETALVHAAAGGTGQLLVQLAKAKGARVIATVGTAAKAEIATALGADHVVRYDQTDDLAAAVRDVTGGVGVDVVYDGVGRATFDASLAALRRRGMLVLFGASSGAVPPVDPQRLNSGGSLYLTRPTLAHFTAERAELSWHASEVFGAIADGSLRVQIGGRYPLERAGDAYRDLEGRRTTGKLLLVR